MLLTPKVDLNNRFAYFTQMATSRFCKESNFFAYLRMKDGVGRCIVPLDSHSLLLWRSNFKNIRFCDLFLKKSIRYSWQKNGGVGGMLGESRLCMSMNLQNCAKWTFVLPSRQRQRCVELICWLVTVDILALCTPPMQVDLRSVKPFPHFVSFKPPLIPQRVVWWKHGESRLHFCKKNLPSDVIINPFYILPVTKIINQGWRK